MCPAHEDERWLRRQAIQIAALLPDDPEAAQAILTYAEELLGTFLMGDDPLPRPVALKLGGARSTVPEALPQPDPPLRRPSGRLRRGPGETVRLRCISNPE
jgi:hypothetical protein